MICTVTDRVSGPCECGEPMEPAHIVEDRGLVELKCARCCPHHRDVEHFVGALATIAGKQEPLF